jgi:hypothetical protein
MLRDCRTSGLLVIVSPDHLYVVDLVQQHFQRSERVEVIVDRGRRELRYRVTGGPRIAGSRTSAPSWS